MVRVLDRHEAAPSDEVVEQWVAGDTASLRRSVVAVNESVGVAVEDAAAAALVLDRARELGVGTHVET